MQVSSLTVNNYRSIGSTPPLKVELGEITVLTGTNDSGKTSFLIASFLSSQILFKRRVNESINYQKLASLEGSKFFNEDDGELTGEQEVRWELQLSSKELGNIFEWVSSFRPLEAELTKLTNNGKKIDKEKVSSFFMNLKVYLDVSLNGSSFNSYDDWLDKELLNSYFNDFFHGDEDGKFDFESYVNLRNIIFGVIKDNLDKNFIKSLDSLYIPSSTRDRLLNLSLEEFDTTQEATSELVKFFKEISKEESRRNGTYKKFTEYCQVLFPELISIEVGTPVHDFINEDLFISWTKNSILQRHPLSRSGAGITNVLYIISKLLRNYTSSSIFFIDEPENGLHPKLQLRFVKLLKKLTSEFGVKVIVSTHSPFIMQKLKEQDKLHLIEHNGRQTTTRPVDFEKKEEAFHALGAYLPLSLTASGIIFVEGQTEVVVLSILLDKAGLDIEKEGILILPLGGENLFNITPRNLKKMHEKSIVIIDSDLQKTLNAGGNIKQSKLTYETECNQHDVECVLLREYRTIENMYPKDVLARVLKISEDDLKHNNFDEIAQITNNMKVSLGQKVASEMTENEALDFPLVKKLIKWWYD